jgi:hypothetical protein
VAREQRNLAAILAADVVGYSRVMGRDESGKQTHSSPRRRIHLTQAVEMPPGPSK